MGDGSRFAAGRAAAICRSADIRGQGRVPGADRSRGSTPTTVQPCGPGPASTRPRSPVKRSVSAARPVPPSARGAGTSPAGRTPPSSPTAIRTPDASRVTSTVTRRAPKACRRTLVSASMTSRYAASSTSPGSAPASPGARARVVRTPPDSSNRRTRAARSPRPRTRVGGGSVRESVRLSGSRRTRRVSSMEARARCPAASSRSSSSLVRVSSYSARRAACVSSRMPVTSCATKSCRSRATWRRCSRRARSISSALRRSWVRRRSPMPAAPSASRAAHRTPRTDCSGAAGDSLSEKRSGRTTAAAPDSAPRTTAGRTGARRTTLADSTSRAASSNGIQGSAHRASAQPSRISRKPTSPRNEAAVTMLTATGRGRRRSGRTSTAARTARTVGTTTKSVTRGVAGAGRTSRTAAQAPALVRRSVAGMGVVSVRMGASVRTDSAPEICRSADQAGPGPVTPGGG